MTLFGVVYSRIPEKTHMLAEDLGAVLDFDFDTNLTFWTVLRDRISAVRLIIT